MGQWKRNATWACASRELCSVLTKDEVTGVAILVDEYDKPLLQNIGNNELQEELRGILRLFYSVLKTQDRYIKFGLLTGSVKVQ